MTDVVLTTGLDTRQALKDIDQLVALARQKFGSVAKMAAAVQGGGSTVARAAKAQASASDAHMRALGRTIAMQRRSTAEEVRAAASSVASSTNTARAAQATATAKMRALGQTIAMQRRSAAEEARAAASSIATSTNAARAADAASIAKMRALGQTIAMQRTSAAQEARTAQAAVRAAAEESRAAQAAAQTVVTAFNAKQKAIQQAIVVQQRAAAEQARAAQQAEALLARTAATEQRSLAAKERRAERWTAYMEAQLRKEEVARARATQVEIAAAEAAARAQERLATARTRASRAADDGALSTRLRIERQLTGNMEVQSRLLRQLSAARRAYHETAATVTPGSAGAAAVSRVFTGQQRDLLAQARAAQAEVAAVNAAAAAQDRLAVARTKALAAADNRALNTQLRIERQLSSNTDLQAQLTNRLTAATAAYRSAVASTTPGTLGAVEAHARLQREFTSISGAIAKTGGLLPSLSRGFSGLSGVMGGLGSVVLNSKVALAGLTAVLGFREFVATTEKLDAFRFTLQAASADSNEFAVSQDFLKQKAEEIGFGYADVGRAFGRFSLATTNAGESTETTRGMFEKLAGAARNLGLSTADVTGVIRALEQSFSKGKFMAEEVRLQLGDRLPFAMQALTKAVEGVLGKGVDINKMFEQGTISTKQFSAAFIDQLFAMSGGARQLEITSKGMQGAFGRLSNAWSDFVQSTGDAGVYDAIIAGVNALTGALTGVAEAAERGALAMRSFKPPSIATDATTVLGLEQSALDIRNELYELEIRAASVTRSQNLEPLEKRRDDLERMLEAVESRNPKLLLARLEAQVKGWQDLARAQAGFQAGSPDKFINATNEALEAQLAFLRKIVAGLDQVDAVTEKITARTPDQLELVPSGSFSADDMDDLVKEMAKFDKVLDEVNDAAKIRSLAAQALAHGYFKGVNPDTGLARTYAEMEAAADKWAKTAIAGLQSNARETKSAEKDLKAFGREIDQLIESTDKFTTNGFDKTLDPISAASADVTHEIEKLTAVIDDARVTEAQRAKMLVQQTTLEEQRAKAVAAARIEFELETLAVKRSAEQMDAETRAILAGLDPRASVAEIDYDRTLALLELEKQTELTRIAEAKRQLENMRENAGTDALKSINDRIAALDTLKGATEKSFDAKKAQAFVDRNADLADEFRDRWGNTIGAVGDLFDDLFGDAASKLGKFGGLVQGLLLDVLRMASGSKASSFGGVIMDVVMSSARAGGASGAGGGVSGFLNTGSNLMNMFSGGPGGLYNQFAMSGLGSSLGLSMSSGAMAAASMGVSAATPASILALSGPAGGMGTVAGLATASTGGTAAAAGLGGAAPALTGLGVAMPYIGAAIAAAMIAYQTGIIGPNPSVGPVGIADFSPGLGRGREFDDRGVDPFTADNGGDGESMRPIAEAIATLIADTADRFEATIDSTLRFRVANYASPKKGSGRDQGFEVNAFLTDETERRIAEGKTPEQATFEALKFAVTEAFAFDSATLAEAVRNTQADTTEELLADLEFAMDFEGLVVAIGELGGVLDGATLETARLRVAIDKEADAKAKGQVDPIREFIKRARELFPAIEGTQGAETTGPLGAISPGSIRDVRMEWDRGALRGATPDLTYVAGSDRFDPSYVQAGDARFDVEQVAANNESGTAFALVDTAGQVVAEFASMSELLAGAGAALAEYHETVAGAAGPLARTAEEQVRYAANLQRVGVAIEIAKQSVSDLVGQITGEFEPTIRGPFQAALEAGAANIRALGPELESVNDEIRASYEAFPELANTLGSLSDVVIDVATVMSEAQADLLNNLKSDYLDSITRRTNSVTGLDAVNSIDDLIDQRDIDRSDAVALGLDGTQADDLFEASVRDMLGGLDAAGVAAILASGQITDQFATNLITEILNELGGTYADQAAAVLAGLATEDLIDAELALIETRREEADAARELADIATANARTLRSAVDSLRIDDTLSPLGPEARMAESMRQFDAALALANDNTPMDAESQAAIQDLPGLGRSALEDAQDYYGSSTQYDATFARITGAMLNTAVAQEDVATQQLAVLTNIEALLEAQGAANDNQPKWVSNGSGQFVSTGAGGLSAGLDLGYDPQRNYDIARALGAAGIGYTGAGEGQLGTLRNSNPLADAILDAMGYANGAAFSGGDVVHTATAFSMGVMGEAGPEAIMPLQRAPDGSLGVRAVGPSSGDKPQGRKSEQRIIAILVDKLDRVEARLAGIESNTGKQVALDTREAARPRKRAA